MNDMTKRLLKTVFSTFYFHVFTISISIVDELKVPSGTVVITQPYLDAYMNQILSKSVKQFERSQKSKKVHNDDDDNNNNNRARVIYIR